jgi:hypothetical protein
MAACEDVGEQEKAAALPGDGLAETQQTNPNKNEIFTKWLWSRL